MFVGSNNCMTYIRKLVGRHSMCLQARSPHCWHQQAWSQQSSCSLLWSQSSNCPQRRCHCLGCLTMGMEVHLLHQLQLYLAVKKSSSGSISCDNNGITYAQFDEMLFEVTMECICSYNTWQDKVLNLHFVLHTALPQLPWTYLCTLGPVHSTHQPRYKFSV